MKIIVAQLGARRRYSIPRMLEKHGLLMSLYTNSSLYSPLGVLIRISRFRNGATERLVNRNPRIGKEITKSTDVGLLVNIFKPFLNHILYQKIYNYLLSCKMKSWGVGDADILYTMFCHNIEFVKFAKGKGLKIVTDVFIHPEYYEYLNEYRKPKSLNKKYSEKNVQYQKEQWNKITQLTDVYIAPSEWVAEGVRSTLSNNSTAVVHVIPYGSSVESDVQNNGIKGRVLFAGRDLERKGFVDLYNAVLHLNKVHEEVQLVVAGPVSKCDKKKYHNPCVHFLGHLTKEEMVREYLKADIFILPSYAEGFAAVIAEALACGCPVVVSKESGAPINDYEEGIFVNPGDVDGIIEAVKIILNDRILRNNMSNTAWSRRKYFGFNAWENRLLEVIENINIR
ncbi:glycosyltransferase family 4 protein [Kiritimatiellota bacterium B12222]|nr:glycosyltransferase family 4 protein [Kiritimatiellota bacterium B12222]